MQQPPTPPGFAGYIMEPFEHDGQTYYILKRKRRKKKKRVRPVPEYVDYNKVKEIVEHWGDYKLPQTYLYLFIAMYLTGSRISEVLDLNRADCRIMVVDGVEILEITIIIGKRRDDKTVRKAPIFINGYEFEMVKRLLEYLKYFGKEEKLFRVCRTTAWRMMKKIDFGGMVLTHKGKRVYVRNWYGHPHYMRHLRASHMKRYYNMDNSALTKWFEWSSPEMAERYAHMEYKDLLKYYKRGDEDG